MEQHNGHLRFFFVHGVLPILVAVFLHQDGGADSRVGFRDQIRPLLNRHCVACHGGVKQAGDLSFVYPDGIASVIETGDADASYLMERITDPEEESRMPPPEHGPRLTDEEVELLRRWINEGAVWEAHWAHEVPVRHLPPSVHQSDWVRQPLDAFVLHRLESLAVAPAPDAQPDQWLRRVSLDLIGLPPTDEERSVFLSAVEAEGEAAYSQAVDRMLDSKHFGERWASVWFDLVRYADSQGLGIDHRRTIWPYRDWVIAAFNQDMPYDEFTIKQIAGDLLSDATIDDRVATGVHRLTQTNEEGGTDDEEFRTAAVLDRVGTVWQTWQATTFGCVQCHSHPYDPIRHEEYYQFVALFNNTQDTDTGDDWPWVWRPANPSDVQSADRLAAEAEQLAYNLWQAEFSAAQQQPEWTSATGMTVQGRVETRMETVDGLEQFVMTGNAQTNHDFELTLPLSRVASPISAIRLTALPLDPERALADSEWGFVLSQAHVTLVDADGRESRRAIARIVGDEPFPRFDPSETLNEKSQEGFSSFTRIHHPRRVVLVLASPIKPAEAESLRLKFVHRKRNSVNHPLIIKRGFVEFTDEPLSESLNGASLADLRNRLRDVRKRLKEIPGARTPILRERPAHLSRPTRLFIRGLYLTKGDPVQPGVPVAFDHTGRPVTNRLELAHWLVDRRNPLTARVAVNRFWARLFGMGLVATEEDFGSTGDPPSHPLLLDDLAVRFQEDYRWSVKRLLQELVLSRTYRQSARQRDDLPHPDTANRLLARGPRIPLSAEMVRDQALAVSGLLSRTQFGPPVHPPIPPGVWRPFQGGDKWSVPEPGHPDRYRRSIYTYVKRSIPYPIHATFDAPTREFCTPRRLRSNTPLQPLMTLNDAVFVECAQSFAERIRNAAPGEVERIRWGYRQATGRDIRAAELAALRKLVQSFPGGQDSPRPWTAVATALLNLDHTMNK